MLLRVLFEVELHTGLKELRHVFHHDSLVKLKFNFINFLLEDEQLVDFLLLLNQVLTRHHRNECLTN